MSTGPFLYDDDPTPLHTGEPRTRNGLIVGLLGGTALVAVLMVVVMPLVNGSGEDQSRDVATVFTSALSQGDVVTAYALICDSERARIAPDQLAGEYLQPGTPAVTAATRSEVDGAPAQLMEVRWDDAGTITTTELTVVPEGGTKVCGTRLVG
ncbi:hypothetical protein GCU67_08535 [Modestobacter muralis]|uniref:Uncharacterized protein n=1 Tax=Modestobacter muralis TaxID=1608614 RepID=A0A6P0H5D7_9ACTN|nr:hypothetical protein [Modestobacter muralis]NEK94219.1 hypothetical protein [Modestobacter muralis]NEN50987.1 hypothetical protein [Modestobacter muralis]